MAPPRDETERFQEQMQPKTCCGRDWEFGGLSGLWEDWPEPTPGDGTRNVTRSFWSIIEHLEVFCFVREPQVPLAECVLKVKGVLPLGPWRPMVRLQPSVLQNDATARDSRPGVFGWRRAPDAIGFVLQLRINLPLFGVIFFFHRDNPFG